MILLSVFLRNNPRYQIIGASLLVQISFFVHVFLRPYDTITSYGMICNKLESVSLLSLVMTLSTGLFFGTIDSGYNLGFFEDVLIVLHARFMLTSFRHDVMLVAIKPLQTIWLQGVHQTV